MVKFLFRKSLLISTIETNKKLSDELLSCWLKIMEDVESFQLHDMEDIIIWHIGKNKKFSVKSLYNALTKTDDGPDHKKVWKSKVQPKIKIFMWLLTNGALLIKDNMVKRNWSGNPVCQFCQAEETINHLFFMCPVAIVI
jgi:hypothetical protein